MAKGWRIREWNRRYEVNVRGHPASPGDKLRVGGLTFVRLPVQGYKIGGGYRALQRIVRSRAQLEAAMCVWLKLLQLAAEPPAELRGGWIRDHLGNLATAETIAIAAGYRLRTVKVGLELLAHPEVSWIVYEEAPDRPGNSPESPGIPGESGTLLETKPNQTKPEEKSKEEALSASRTPPAADTPPYKEIMEAWNSAVSGIKQLRAIRAMTDSRKTHLRARWQEPAFRNNWARIIEQAVGSDFFRKAGRTWATFGWLIKNDDNYTKVLEGNYDNEPEGEASAGADQQQEAGGSGKGAAAGQDPKYGDDRTVTA